MTELTEQWRPIEGYEGYEVSNLGKVRRVKGYDSAGRKWKGRILKPQIKHNGYLQVSICKEGKKKWFLVHRLVAMTFIPNPEGLGEINHKNETKTDNRVENIEWCTARYNSNYGTRTERQVQTKIKNGTYDPELCGLGDKKERDLLYYQKNLEKMREQGRERQRKYRLKNRDQINERRREQRLKKKQSSEESLW